MSDKDELERQRFEAWLKTIFDPILRRQEDGKYSSVYVQLRWESWQAALSSKQEEA